jgi:hypothetical protein
VSAFIQAVVEEVWIKALRHPITFYNNVTAYNLLKYLQTNSCGLRNNDLATLPAAMLHFYADVEGIPEFILKLEKACEKLERRGVPMLDATLLATAHSQVFASLHFPEATQEWERLPPASQTWEAWQLKYREANIKRLRLQRANPHSFGAANNATDAQVDSTAIALALNNISNAATNDSTLMASLVPQLAAITTHLDSMHQHQGVAFPLSNPPANPPPTPTTTPPPAIYYGVNMYDSFQG